MASIIYTIILIVVLLILIREKKDEESYFRVKIIGYFILGSFAFNLNQIPLPLGFVLYLLFFRPKVNGNVKHLAAIYGVLTFVLVHWILPFAIQEWENRPHSIEHEINSVYSMDFQNEFKLIKGKFNLENNELKLEDFEVDYVKDGSIKEFRWELLSHQNDRYIHYQINYDVDNKRYRVTKSQLDMWPQYDRLIGAGFFFENIKMLDIKDITQDKGKFPYYVIRSSGESVSYASDEAVDLHSLFVVENGEIHLIEQLPIEGYEITTFAMKKTEEQRNKQGNIIQESFEGTYTTGYLFKTNGVE
jgi:hypothetical protein